MAYEDFDAFSRGQAAQTRGAAPLIQNMADPWGPQRGQYQNQLNTLLSNPGSFESSPVFQFAYQQGLDNLNNRLAGSGMSKSGNALKAAMDYGREATSQLFYPQANLLSKLAGVDSSSPAAAALAWGNMFGRGQDQESIAAASRSLGRGGPSGGAPQTPWWQQPMQMPTSGSQSAGWGRPDYGSTGLPSGGYGIPAETSPYTGAGYLPSGGYGGFEEDIFMRSPQDYGGYGQDYGDNWDLMGDAGAYGFGGGESYDYPSFEYTDTFTGGA